MSYENLFSVKTTPYDISNNYYFDRIKLKKDIDAGSTKIPAGDNLIDMSYIQFKNNYINDNSFGIDCCCNSINNIKYIDFSLNVVKYLQFIFDREIVLNNIQFKNYVLGDVSFVLWRRVPVFQEIYYDLSKTLPYRIIGDSKPVNIQSINNIEDNLSYDYVFEFFPPQTVPTYMSYETYPSDDIFNIDNINLNNINDPSFIMYYTSNSDDISSLYLNPDTYMSKFTNSFSNVALDAVSVDEIFDGVNVAFGQTQYSYITDSSNLSIEKLNTLLNDLSSVNLNGVFDTRINKYPIQIDTTYPNFKFQFSDDIDTSNINISSDSKLLNYLGINYDISYNEQINFTFNEKPKTTIQISRTPMELNINDNNYNNNIEFINYNQIDFIEKRPITDGSGADISNNGPKNYEFFIKDNINEIILNTPSGDIIKRTNDGIVLDLSKIDISFVITDELNFNSIEPSNITINCLSGIINTLVTTDISFSLGSTFTVSDLSINTLIVNNKCDITDSNINKLDASNSIINYLDLSNTTITISSSDISKSYINFIDTNSYYTYLKFEFNTPTNNDLSINKLKIQDLNNLDVSFTVRELSNNNFYEPSSPDTSNCFTGTFSKDKKNFILELSNHTFVTSFSYERNEKFFNIDDSNNTIIYSIDENKKANDDSVNDICLNNYVFKIKLPSGNWSISEINALLAETSGNYYSQEKNVSMNVEAYKTSGSLTDISNVQSINISTDGLKPRNTHFNKYVPFTALYINNKPSLITSFDYQIHDISGYRQPNNIYTFYDKSTFLEYFFDPSYLVPYDSSGNEISGGIIPDNFISYNWNYPTSYNNIKRLGSNVISHQTRGDTDISNNHYQNILFNLKMDSFNLYAIYDPSTNISDGYDISLGNNIPYDKETFVYDHYKRYDNDANKFINYEDLIPDLSTNMPRYEISNNCVPILDTSINDNSNCKGLYLNDISINTLLTNIEKKIYINYYKDLIKDYSNNYILKYNISNSTLFFDTDVVFKTPINIIPDTDLIFRDYDFTYYDKPNNFNEYEDYYNNNSNYNTTAIYANYLDSYKIEAGNIYNLSDDREKHNENDLSNCIQTVNKIKPYKYYKTIKPYIENITLNVNNLPNDAKIETGYIAQDISAIHELTHLVNDDKDILSLNYTGVQPYLTGALKELNTKIKSNDTIINDLKDRINILKNNI